MNKENLNHFLADVFALKLRFPVAEIAKRTGDDKISVCAYVRGRKPPPHTFLIRFYRAFKKELAAIGINRTISKLNQPPPANPSPVVGEVWRKFNQNLDKQLEMLKSLNKTSERIEQKIDQLLKWSKYGGQVWEKN